jgi:hypothetical protein
MGWKDALIQPLPYPIQSTHIHATNTNANTAGSFVTKNDTSLWSCMFNPIVSWRFTGKRPCYFKQHTKIPPVIVDIAPSYNMADPRTFTSCTKPHQHASTSNTQHKRSMQVTRENPCPPCGALHIRYPENPIAHRKQANVKQASNNSGLRECVGKSASHSP